METLDICFRFVIPRENIVEGFKDDYVALEIAEELTRRYAGGGMQVHLVEISEGLIIDANIVEN